MLEEKSRVFQKLKSRDVLIATNSRTWSLSLWGWKVHRLLSCLVLTKLDRIASFGPWITSGPIKLREDDSITHVPFEREVLLKAIRRFTSRRLESKLTSVKAKTILLQKLLSAKMNRNVRFYISCPQSLMVQTELCAHSHYCGLKAIFSSWVSRKIGIRHQKAQVGALVLLIWDDNGEKNFLLPTRNDMAALQILKQLKKEKTSLLEHLECLHIDQNRFSAKPVPRKTFIPKRKQLTFNWGCMMLIIEKEMGTKRDNIHRYMSILLLGSHQNSFIPRS